MGKRKVETVAAEPVTSDDWWQRIEALKRRQAEAVAERTALMEMLGSLTLQAAGEDGEAESGLAHVRERLAGLANVEQEVGAIIRVAERRWRAAGDAAYRARREESRERARALGEDRRTLAQALDIALADVEEYLRAFYEVGRRQTACFQDGGGHLEMGRRSDASDARTIKEAVCKRAPLLAAAAEVAGFDPSIDRSGLQPLTVSEGQRQRTLAQVLMQASVRDELEAEPPAVVEIAA